MTIMKQLIEQMIGNYLHESYEDDLVESIFEEVSEETWEAIEEAILNELSPSLLNRYAKAAETRRHIDRKNFNAATVYGDDDEAEEIAKSHNKRLAGEKLAKQKLARGPLASQRQDLKDLSAFEFMKKHKMRKSEWRKKYDK
jgi:hypothetical protein